MKKRWHYMDVIRFCGTALIVLYHFIVNTSADSGFPFQAYGISEVGPNFNIATLSVGLFFMISGAGLMISSQDSFDWKKYAKSRVLRMMIPFYLAWIVSAGLLYFCEILPGWGEVPVWRAIFTVLGIDGYIQTASQVPNFYLIGEWFLGCLLILYVLFPFFRYVLLKNRYVEMGVAVVYYVLLTLFFPFKIMGAHTSILVKGFDFFLGMFLALECGKWKKPTLIFSLPVMLVLLFSPVSLPISSVWKVELLCLAVFMTLRQMEPLLEKVPAFTKAIAGMNRYSFAFFLMHHTVIYCYSRFFAGAIQSPRAVVFLFLANITTTAFFACIITKISDAITTRCRKKSV